MPKGKDLISARCVATRISEAMQAAYWTEAYGHEQATEMHVREAENSIIELAQIFGLEVKGSAEGAAS